ncbi:uncharacterized protein B0T15DRAFT_394709 [Chaetomium strumarium]|uniref:Uncharacterized protein n=1 Tax=Chaetomium strumarium TaxID=1170767 RepID=A0AAJ0GW33_9PEZI|nr:hypothetical protein B0T15DRAFT_394709 [Chaetomium strumarium]
MSASGPASAPDVGNNLPPQNVTTTTTTITARTFPPLGVVLSESTFSLWKEKFLRTLQRNGLLDYIENDVPEPAERQAKLQWINNRADIQEFIETYMTSDIQQILAASGWNVRQFDLKGTLEKLEALITDRPGDYHCQLAKELANIRRENFDSMTAFTTCIAELRNALKNSDICKVTDKGVTLFALRGIEQEYPEVAQRARVGVEAGTYTWEAMIREFSLIAKNETVNLGLAAVKSDNNGNNSNKGGKSDKKKGDNRADCDVCGRKQAKKAKHCKDCDNHHKGDICWYCHPEEAPDSWAKKQEYLEKKKKKQGKGSTTAPLHQQSGVANPTDSNIKVIDNNGKKVFFTTSNFVMTAMSPSHFQEGSQHY